MIRSLHKIIKLTFKSQKIRNCVSAKPTFSPMYTNYTTAPKVLKISNKREELNPPSLIGIWALSVLTWLGLTSEDENKESELIMTLKRAVLCTKREQYNKAEQLLHVALRLAQQQENDQGILYCYDLMANLAFEQQDLDKAEKLFVNVLQILLNKGTKQDDLKVIHISLKLARICQLRAELDKADLGYQWCLEQIVKQKDDTLDCQLLYGVIQDWYAQFLLDKGEANKALTHLKEAYQTCEKTLEANNEKSMLLLNDLGITSFRAGDVTGAIAYLNQGILVGNKVDDQTHIGVLHANLGLVLLHHGALKEAQKYCKEAWNLGRKNENRETIEQANYCFDQIKLNLGNEEK
ncbi:hypothetical protein WA026_007973 [Henosepilachna vigintioctopunctata]|uniref:Tetratricopeptide repeat protein 19 homolog, mitochondrial n=1 Tax=Henosepilachna vigintioctopunctata TaxID=420089 RepID=A0AAW1TTC3_9CUCU